MNTIGIAQKAHGIQHEDSDLQTFRKVFEGLKTWHLSYAVEFIINPYVILQISSHLLYLPFYSTSHSPHTSQCLGGENEIGTIKVSLL